MVTRLDGIQHSQTHSYSLFLHGQSQDDLGMGLLVSEMHGNMLAMTLGTRCSMKTWRDGVRREVGQGTFPTQESNLDLPYCKRILYHLSHQGSPDLLSIKPFANSGFFSLLRLNMYRTCRPMGCSPTIPPPLNSYAEDLNPSTTECNFIWK